MREIVLLLLVILSVPLVLKRPVWGMAIYFGINVVRPEMLFWGGSTGSFVFKLYFGLIIAASLSHGCLKNAGRLLNREFFLMVWLFLAVVASVQFASFPVHRGNYYVLELLKGFIICAVLYLSVHDFVDIRRIQSVLLGCFAFLGAWGVQQQFLGNERLEGLGGHAWSDSNAVAATFVLFLPVAIVKLYEAKKGRELCIAIGVVAIMIALIVCTKSRAGLVGIIASLAALGFYSRRFARVAITAVFLAVVALPFVTESYTTRVKTMGSSETLDTSARLRLVMWQAGMKVFSEYPLFGSGFLTFAEAKMKHENDFLGLDDELRQSAFREENKRVTHNTYIQMLSDCGVFGALPFCLLVFGGIAAGMKGRRLLATAPEKQSELLWLCGLSAGVTGYAVVIMSIDASLSLFLYSQLAFLGILTRRVAGEEPARSRSYAYRRSGAAVAAVANRSRMVKQRILPVMVLVLWSPLLSSCNGGAVRVDQGGGIIFSENFDSHPDWNTEGALNKDCGTGCTDAPTGWSNYFAVPAVGNLATVIRTLPDGGADHTGGSGKKAYLAYYNNVTYSGGAELSKTFPQDYQELYLRVWIRAQPGWQTAPDSSIKLFRVIHYDRTGSAFAYFPGGNGAPMAGFNWATNSRYRSTNGIPDGSYIAWFRCDPQATSYSCPQPPYNVDTAQRLKAGVAPGSPGGFADGQWHRYDLHVKMNTLTGSTWNRDGVYELWYDGNRIISHSDVQWKYPGSAPEVGWNTIQLGGNNSNPYPGGSSPQWAAFDDVVVSTSPLPEVAPAAN